MSISTIKAVLFDLDGTLIDSEYFYYSNWSPILQREFEINISFEDWIKDFAGHTLVRNVQFLRERYKVETDEESMWNKTRAAYAQSDMTSIRLMPHVKEVLEGLQKKGVRIALVTSSYRSTVDTVLGYHQLLDYFEFFVTRERVNNPKPNPEPYLLATELLGLPKENIIAVEDTITGYTSASSAGLVCAAVTKHQTEKQRLADASYLFEDLSALSKLIL